MLADEMVETPRRYWVLVALVLLHLALGAAFAFNTPYRSPGILLGQRGPEGPAKVPDVGAPDERQHANYVQHLLDGKGFPVLNPKDPNLGENYQAHQPPLYYLVAAGFAKVVGVANVDDPSGIRLRLLNVLIGGATVAGAFFLGLWGFRCQTVATAAATLTALLPMNLALSGAISNDPLLYALCAWTLAICARALRDGWTTPLALAAGTCGALALVDKTTGIALVPILLFAGWAAPTRIQVRQLAIGLVPYLAIAVPWLARNLTLYGDPFAISAFNQAFVNSPQASSFIEGFGAQTYWTQWVGWWTARSFFGAFGYMDIFLNETGRPMAPQETLYRLLSASMLIALLAWALGTLKGTFEQARKVQAMNAIFLGIVILLFLRFNAQYFQGQARYLFPALGVIGCGVGAAISLAKRPSIGLGLLALMLLGLNAYTLSVLPGEFAKRTEVSARP